MLRLLAVVPSAADAKLIGIVADYLNMIQFASYEDRKYKKVSEYLWLLAKDRCY